MFCFFTVFEQQLLLKKTQKSISRYQFIFGRRASSFATDSEIRNHLCDRTTHRCALHCSIPVKNVIYSYLFITEKATLRCPVKVEGIPPPFTHTHSTTGQNKRFRVVNRVEAAECEERLSVCVCVCVVLFLNE